MFCRDDWIRTSDHAPPRLIVEPFKYLIHSFLQGWLFLFATILRYYGCFCGDSVKKLTTFSQKSLPPFLGKLTTFFLSPGRGSAAEELFYPVLVQLRKEDSPEYEHDDPCGWQEGTEPHLQLPPDAEADQKVVDAEHAVQGAEVVAV